MSLNPPLMYTMQLYIVHDLRGSKRYIMLGFLWWTIMASMGANLATYEPPNNIPFFAKLQKFSIFEDLRPYGGHERSLNPSIMYTMKLYMIWEAQKGTSC